MSFFNSDSDRDLWIRLNSERQIDWEKSLTYFDKESGTHKPTLQALHPRSMEEAIEISKRQLEVDEKNGVQRYTLEDLLTLSIEQLNEKDAKRHQEWVEKFNNLK